MRPRTSGRILAAFEWSRWPRVMIFETDVRVMSQRPDPSTTGKSTARRTTGKVAGSDHRGDRRLELDKRAARCRISRSSCCGPQAHNVQVYRSTSRRTFNQVRDRRLRLFDHRDRWTLYPFLPRRTSYAQDETPEQQADLVPGHPQGRHRSQPARCRRCVRGPIRSTFREFGNHHRRPAQGSASRSTSAATSSS